MNIYYCPDCTKELDRFKIFKKNLSYDPIGSTYQQDKYKKHTGYSTRFPKVGVFNDKSEKAYRGLVNRINSPSKSGVFRGFLCVCWRI